MIIAHRGASGVAYQNSHKAFSLAVADPVFRADGIEFDLHTTRDGSFVVHHDAVLADGRLISRLSRKEIGEYRLPDNSTIPYLEDLLPYSGRINLFCEVKSLPPEWDQMFLERISQAARNFHLHSFDHRTVARLYQQAPGLSYGVLSSSYPLDPIGPVKACGATRLWQEWPLIDEELVDLCHGSGITLVAWTVNQIETATRLRRLGVDDLCGNWPDRLQVELE